MYQIDAQGQIIRIDGAVIERDITSPAYQQFLHWQQNGQPAAEVKPKIVEKAVDIEVE